jgi:hypothetical protein
VPLLLHNLDSSKESDSLLQLQTLSTLTNIAALTDWHQEFNSGLSRWRGHSYKWPNYWPPNTVSNVRLFIKRMEQGFYPNICNRYPIICNINVVRSKWGASATHISLMVMWHKTCGIKQKAVSATDVMIFKIFSLKNSSKKNWRFWLKTKLIYAKCWS